MLDIHLISAARPYAKAAFSYAVEKKKLENWSILLSQASLVVKNEMMQALLKDFRFEQMIAYDCLVSACKQWIFRSGGNFLKLVALNRRLLTLPVITELFEHYKNQRSKKSVVQTFSSYPLTETEVLALKTVLKKRLRHDIELDLSVDVTLLGGLMIRIGSDFVIDTSVRSKLDRLRATLVN